MDTSEVLTGEDLHTYDDYSYTPIIAIVVVVGVPLAVLALCKVHVDHEHKREAWQARRDTMEEYRKAKSGYVAALHHDLVATRMDSEEQRMRLQDKEQALRQRHKKEVNELETKHSERERDLEAKLHKIERQKEAQLNKERQQRHEFIKQSQEKISSLQNRNKGLELILKKQKQTVEEQAKKYAELTDKYSTELRLRDEKECALRKQFEKKLDNKERENRQLEKDLLNKKAESVQLEKELQKEEARVQELEKQLIDKEGENKQLKFEKKQLEQQLEDRKEETKRPWYKLSLFSSSQVSMQSVAVDTSDLTSVSSCSNTRDDEST